MIVSAPRPRWLPALGLLALPPANDGLDGERDRDEGASRTVGVEEPTDPRRFDSESEEEREGVLGALLGLTREDRRLRIELVSTDEFLSKRRGGLTAGEASKYRGNLDLTFTFDLGGFGFPADATLFVYAQHGHGDGLSDEYLGDLQTVSNIDADDFTQVSEVWYEQVLADGALRIKLGKQDSNSDFIAVDHGVDFLNSSFALIPTVPAPTFPDPALGLAAIVEIVEGVSIGGGIYDGDANGGTSGLSSAFDGRGGTFSLLEGELRPGRERASPGTYRFGVWHHSAETERVGLPASAGARFEGGNRGAYVAIDQPLYRESGAAEEGLGLFLQLGIAPEDRNELARYFGGGLIYTGLFEERNEDVLGLGIARAELSDRITDREGRTSETVFELFYKARVLPWLTVQTDLQFVGNPGGDGEDALVVGLRLETVL